MLSIVGPDADLCLLQLAMLPMLQEVEEVQCVFSQKPLSHSGERLPSWSGHQRDRPTDHLETGHVEQKQWETHRNMVYLLIMSLVEPDHMLILFISFRSTVRCHRTVLCCWI